MRNCPGLILSINMSIDGIGEKHDQIRGLKNSFDNLVKSYNALRELKQQYPNLNLASASVVTNSNQDSIGEMLLWVRDHMDIQAHGLMLARGDTKSPEGSAPSDEVFVKALQLHRELAGSSGILADAIANDYAQSRIDTLRAKRMKDPCLAGKKLI